MTAATVEATEPRSEILEDLGYGDRSEQMTATGIQTVHEQLRAFEQIAGEYYDRSKDVGSSELPITQLSNYTCFRLGVHELQRALQPDSLPEAPKVPKRGRMSLNRAMVIGGVLGIGIIRKNVGAYNAEQEKEADRSRNYHQSAAGQFLKELTGDRLVPHTYNFYEMETEYPNLYNWAKITLDQLSLLLEIGGNGRAVVTHQEFLAETAGYKNPLELSKAKVAIENAKRTLRRHSAESSGKLATSVTGVTVG